MLEDEEDLVGGDLAPPEVSISSSSGKDGPGVEFGMMVGWMVGLLLLLLLTREVVV